MLRNVPVSRKSFIASAVALCSIAISPKQSKAQPLEVEFPSAEEYIEAVNESGTGWTTYALDENGAEMSKLSIDSRPCLWMI